MNISLEDLNLNKFVRDVGEGRQGSKESVLISYSLSICHVISKFHSSTFENFSVPSIPVYHDEQNLPFCKTHAVHLSRFLQGCL